MDWQGAGTVAATAMSASALLVLGRAVATTDIRASQFQVFGDTAADALTPQIETATLQGAAHQQDYLRLIQPKLQLYCFKGRAVFPRHFNHSGFFVGC